MADSEEKIDYGEVVKEALETNGWHFSVRKYDDGNRVFRVPMSAKNCPGLNVRLEVAPGGDSKVRCYVAEDTPKSVRAELLEAINYLNGHYRYLTLSIDSDGDILAAYDFTIFGEDKRAIDKHAGTMILLVSDIIDKCIPTIMKIVWSATENEENED